MQLLRQLFPVRAVLFDRRKPDRGANLGLAQ